MREQLALLSFYSFNTDILLLNMGAFAYVAMRSFEWSRFRRTSRLIN